MMGEYDAGYENYIDSLIREIEKLQDENDKLSEQVSSLVGRSFRTADKMSCIEAENAELQNDAELLRAMLSQVQTEKRCYMAENAELRESLEYANNECEKESMEYLSTQAENAKLRERVDELEELEDGKRYIPQEWYQLAMTDNAKLRELVRDMWRDGMCECDERGACAECEYHFPDRMRELGVEVEQ